MVRRVLVALLVAILVTGAVVSLDFWRSDPPTETRSVALLLAGSADPDPEFRQQVVLACPDCTVQVEQAEGSAARQVQQLADAVSAEVDVVVLEAVDPDSAASQVPTTSATTRVVALGRAVPGATAYVGADDDAIAGDLVRAIADEVGKAGRVLLVEPPASYGARLAAVAGTGLDPVGRLRAPSGDDVTAATAAALRRELRTTPVRELDAILTLDGDQAAAVDAVLTQRRVAAGQRPLLAGEAHDLASLRRLVLGTQRWVAWTDPRAALDRAGALAGRLAGGEAVPTEQRAGVPVELLAPVLVTVETLTDTLVRRGAVTIDELCEGDTEQRCTALGLR